MLKWIRRDKMRFGWFHGQSGSQSTARFTAVANGSATEWRRLRGSSSSRTYWSSLRSSQVVCPRRAEHWDYLGEKPKPPQESQEEFLRVTRAAAPSRLLADSRPGQNTSRPRTSPRLSLPFLFHQTCALRRAVTGSQTGRQPEAEARGTSVPVDPRRARWGGTRHARQSRAPRPLRGLGSRPARRSKASRQSRRIRYTECSERQPPREPGKRSGPPTP